MNIRLVSWNFSSKVTALVMAISSMCGNAYGFFGWFEKSKEEKTNDGDKVPLDVDWSMLRTLDPNSGHASDALQARNGKSASANGKFAHAYGKASFDIVGESCKPYE